MGAMGNREGGVARRTTWDEIYAKEGYEKEPDQELVELLRGIPQGKALEVGAGGGRHTLWIASQGWRVDAFDISSVGIAKLKEQAEKYELSVNCWVGSAADQDFGEQAYDLVISSGSVLNFFKKERSKQIIERMKSAVKVGGFIYVTLSTVDDPSYQRHRKQAKDVVDDSFFVEKWNVWLTAFQPEELMGCFRDFEILSYEEKEVHDTHGQPHTHMMAFLLAKRL
jgi:2-polyprenyl-3-methyl-5-hydroxy-6-metoxy-1,4-benzoquinol methylase